MGVLTRSVRSVLAGSLVLGGALAVSVIGTALPASATTAVTFYVSPTGVSGGFCETPATACGSIQTAINTAEGGSYNGDDVTINVGAGAYTGSNTVNDSSLNSLTIAGAGAGATIVNGGGTDGPIFNIINGTVAFNDLAIDNGYENGLADGAGIDACAGRRGSSEGDDCVITVTNSSFSNNQEFSAGSNSYGGAIAVATHDGGTGSLTVTDSTFTDNYAQTAGGAIDICDAVNGSSVDTGCNLVVTGSTFIGNGAYYGAGAINIGGNPYENGISSATASITDSTFTDNSGRNAVVSGSNSGGAPTTVTSVTDSTFVGNDGAITNGPGGTLKLGASIVAGGASGANCNGTNTDEGYNISDDATCGFTAATSHVNTTTLDTDLGALANNGGPTQTILPLTGSPVIGAIPVGTTLPDGVDVCPRTDQRGVSSVGNCTIGAVEVGLCAAGLTPQVLKATYGTSTFTGLFCVNTNGVGTYTQDTATGTVSGIGAVTTWKGTIIIGAVGEDLLLLGATNGTTSHFGELAPTPSYGTFTLS